MKKVLQSIVLLLGILMFPATALAQDVYGDVNADREVNIADINAVIDIILDDDGYTAAADVNGDGEINIADINAVIDIILGGDEPQGDYVDLGLPSGTLWATRNVGASSPEDYGDYFAWGETEPKEVYSWKTYKWCEGNEWSITKYEPGSFWAYDEIELEPADDAAHVNWGSLWRMPSEAQFQELCDSCSWQWTERNGVNGQLVTGPNGNSIFLPATGYRSNSQLGMAGKRGFYWSRTVNYNDERYAFYLEYDSKSASCIAFYPYRNAGCAVRPVRVEPADEQSLYVEQHSLDMGQVPTSEARADELTIINNTNETVILTVTTDDPFLLKQEDGSTWDMTIEVPGNSIAPVSVMFVADTPGDFNGQVIFQCSALDGGQSVIPVHARAIDSGYEEHEYVNLGLPSGTLWATCNIGASSPEDCGDYFAWGETAPKGVYTWDTYKWYKGGVNNSGLLKYSIDDAEGYNGYVDNKTELDLDDDAAFVNWGPSWRMPTEEQIDELYNNCSSTWTQRNGVNGMLLTGPNHKTLFLPTTGILVSGRPYNVVTEGYYWSRTLYESSSNPIYLTFYSESLYYFWEKRCYGLPVRAVRASQN